jgi:hypothetical protein
MEDPTHRINTLQSKVRRLEILAIVVLIVGPIFGFGGAWGAKIINDTRKDISQLEIGRDSLTIQLTTLKGQLNASSDGLTKIRLANEDLFQKYVNKKEATFTAFEQQKIIDNLPKGTILGWFKPTIPKGWKICDGTEGTPNLNDRFPIGTIPQNNNLGSLVGEKEHGHTVHGETQLYTEKAMGDGKGPFELARGLNGFHTHTIDLPTSKASNIPPATYIIFIEKI